MNSKPLKYPLVSVIVPTYNRAYCLGRTIQSVIDQTYKNWELIIVDNNSTDDTSLLVASFNSPRIQLFQIHNEGVIATSRNKGLHEAKGDYVALLDSDDWWLPEKLHASVEQLDAGADIVYHDLYLVKSFPCKPKLWKRVKSRQVISPVFQDLLFNGNVINNSSVVVKRELMKQIGGFSDDPLLITAEDFDAWIRLAKITEAFVRLNKPFGYYWGGGNNNSAPQRTITSMRFLLERYAKELGKDQTDFLPGWMSYSLARAYYLIGQFEPAKGYAKEALFRKNKLFVKLKAIITVLLSTKKFGLKNS